LARRGRDDLRESSKKRRRLTEGEVTVMVYPKVDFIVTLSDTSPATSIETQMFLLSQGAPSISESFVSNLDDSLFAYGL
jgi:hypothetical protein